jgi:hypothetical protein
MVVRNASSGPNITAGLTISASANAARTANSPSPRFWMYSDREAASAPIPEREPAARLRPGRLSCYYYLERITERP